MATLAVENATITGVNPLTRNAADVGGDDFPNNEKTIAIIENGSGAPITVTLDDTASTAPSGAKAFDADVDVVIAAGDVAVIYPFLVGRFTNSVALTYSDVTLLTVALVSVA